MTLRSLFLASAMALFTLASPLALAHATITSSSPAANAVLDKAPEKVVLNFNEAVEEAFSSISVSDASGAEVSKGKARLKAGAPEVLELDLPKLAPAQYTVNWVGVGPDGHRRKGKFLFQVK